MSEGSAFPFSEVKSVKEIEALADADFVRCAYLKILGREPDPVGGRYYVSMLRRGYSKLSVLDRLNASEEAQGRIPVLDGIDGALARHRKRTGTGWGKFVAAIVRNGDDPVSRRRRAFWHFLEAQYASMDRQSNHGAHGESALSSNASEPAPALLEAIEASVEHSAVQPLELMREDLKTRLLRIESLLLRRGGNSAAGRAEEAIAPVRKASGAAARPAKRT